MSVDNKSIDTHGSNNSLINRCEKIRINSISDIFDPSKNYVGLIDYLTGDIYIKESLWIYNNIPSRVTNRNYLHGKLFYFIYKYWKRANEINYISGFSYLNNQWEFISRTLNTSYENGRMSKTEKTYLKSILNSIYINHYWLQMNPNSYINYRNLSTIELDKKYSCQVHPSIINTNRKLHGILKSSSNHNNNNSRLQFIQCIGLDRDVYVHTTSIINYSNSSNYSGKNLQFNLIEDNNHQWKPENIIIISP